MAETRVDKDGFLWEKSMWTGNWTPVTDNWGNHKRARGQSRSSYWGGTHEPENSENARGKEVSDRGGFSWFGW